MKPKTIAIVGAGPAGAWLAQSLAKQGFKVSLFDHRAPWEKPCGGGLYTVIWDEFPELEPLKSLGIANQKARLITVKKQTVDICLSAPLYTICRKRLDEYLIEKATAAGAVFIRRKVCALAEKNYGFEITDDQGEVYAVDFLVGADGCGSLVRRKLSPGWSKPDFVFTLSCMLQKTIEMPVTFYFFPGLTGYAWIFPGPEKTSIGIGANAGAARAGELAAFLKEALASVPGLEDVAQQLQKDLTPAMIPGIRPWLMRNWKVAGKNWALIGDASGAAHPVSGGGIQNAFRTAKYLGDALSAGAPENYQQKWRSFCKEELLVARLWGPLFFKPYMQRLFADMMVKSRSAQGLAAELLPGGKVKRGRILKTLIRSLAETWS